MCGSGSTAAALRSRELRKRLLQSIRKVVRVPLHMPVNSKMGCWLSPCPSPPLQRLRGCYTSPSLGPQSVTPIEAINRAEGHSARRRVPRGARFGGTSHTSSCKRVLFLLQELFVSASHIPDGCWGRWMALGARCRLGSVGPRRPRAGARRRPCRGAEPSLRSN